MNFKVGVLCFLNSMEQNRSPSMSSLEHSRDFSVPSSLCGSGENLSYPFVHEKIANILSCNNVNSSLSGLINEETWEINHNPPNGIVDLQTLVSLAHASDKLVFTDISRFRPSSRGLIKVACTMNVATATLLAVNILESAIRQATGNANGKAPLLKTMLNEMEGTNHNLAKILKSLLLPFPTDGINLRNLLWHGFVSELPRPWFSLVLLLVYNLEKQQGEKLPVYHDKSDLIDLKSFDTLKNLIEDFALSSSDIEKMINWLPATSHRDLLQLAISWQKGKQYPACTAVLLSILIEHGLRIQWCHINDRSCDLIARPGSYFVTLDGHGQRNQHDLLLHPYLGQDEQLTKKNSLIEYLGGGTIALLTDLFASSCGGPNVRAALAHGNWQSYIEEDLISMDVDAFPRIGNKKGTTELWNIVQILFVAFKTVATTGKETSLLSYSPQFSYTASTIRSMKDALHSLEHLDSVRMEADQFLCPIANKHSSRRDILDLRVSTSFLRDLINKLNFVKNESQDMAWTSCDVFTEYDHNVILSDCAAARALLCETDELIKSYNNMLREALHELESDSTIATRQYRRAIRLVNMVEETLSLYSFVLFVALLFIEAKIKGNTNEIFDVDGVLLQAVKRSRMCISTFSTFLPTNLERSIKSVQMFSRGKAIKAVIKKAEDLLN